MPSIKSIYQKTRGAVEATAGAVGAVAALGTDEGLSSALTGGIFDKKSDSDRIDRLERGQGGPERADHTHEELLKEKTFIRFETNLMKYMGSIVDSGKKELVALRKEERTGKEKHAETGKFKNIRKGFLDSLKKNREKEGSKKEGGINWWKTLLFGAGAAGIGVGVWMGVKELTKEWDNIKKEYKKWQNTLKRIENFLRDPWAAVFSPEDRTAAKETLMTDEEKKAQAELEADTIGEDAPPPDYSGPTSAELAKRTVRGFKGTPAELREDEKKAKRLRGSVGQAPGIDPDDEDMGGPVGDVAPATIKGVSGDDVLEGGEGADTLTPPIPKRKPKPPPPKPKPKPPVKVEPKEVTPNIIKQTEKEFAAEEARWEAEEAASKKKAADADAFYSAETKFLELQKKYKAERNAADVKAVGESKRGIIDPKSLGMSWDEMRKDIKTYDYSTEQKRQEALEDLEAGAGVEAVDIKYSADLAELEAKMLALKPKDDAPTVTASSGGGTPAKAPPPPPPTEILSKKVEEAAGSGKTTQVSPTKSVTAGIDKTTTTVSQTGDMRTEEVLIQSGGGSTKRTESAASTASRIRGREEDAIKVRLRRKFRKGLDPGMSLSERLAAGGKYSASIRDKTLEELKAMQKGGGGEPSVTVMPTQKGGSSTALKTDTNKKDISREVMSTAQTNALLAAGSNNPDSSFNRANARQG